MKWWTCAETYRGTGRTSMLFIRQVKDGERPDDPHPCNEEGKCELMGRKGKSCCDDNNHISYPFNDMGGIVLAGPFDTAEEAEAAFPVDEDEVDPQEI